MNCIHWKNYLSGMEVINASEQLLSIEVSQYPNLNKKTKNNIYKKYQKILSKWRTVKKLSLQDAMKKLGNING